MQIPVRFEKGGSIIPTKLSERLFGSQGPETWTARLLEPSIRDSGRVRVLMYCASNVGLGHLHRLTRIADALRAEIAELDVLLVTDTQTLTAGEIDPAIGLVRLPAFEFRDGSFKNRPAGMELEKQELRDLRANLILAAATGFQPHVVLMDTNPHGKRNELEPLLELMARLKKPPVRILLLRDIPFPPEEASRLSGDRARAEADFAFYDRIFVAGDRSFFDLTRHYGWSREVDARLEYLGFVSPAGKARAREVTTDTDPGSVNLRKPVPVERWEGEGGAVSPVEGEQPAIRETKSLPRHCRIVAAMGGGWELETFGHPVVDAYLHLYPDGGHGAQFSLFTGPGVETSEFDGLAALVKGRPDMRIERYSREFADELKSCDLAVLQAGSTPFQILESDIPMLIYSRDYSTAEQESRAERLCVYPGIERIRREDLEPSRLAGRMRTLLDEPRSRRTTGFSFAGAERAAEIIAEGLRERGQAR